MAERVGLSAASARQVLRTTRASQEQANVFEAFLDLVVQEVEARQSSRSSFELLVATDLSRLELFVVAEASLVVELAGTFVRQIGLPESEQGRVAQLKKAVDRHRAEQACLWCRLKRIGSQEPRADVGFTSQGQLDFRELDASLPLSDDYQALARHAAEEKCDPCLYGGSLLPGLAPAILEYDMVKVKTTKLLLSGLGFFRGLGFGKPEDVVVRQLISCKPDRCLVRAFLTAEGLTQMSLRLFGTARMPIRETAQALNIQQADQVQEVYRILGESPDLMEYTMDSQGCSLAVGYSSPTPARVAN